MTIPPSGRTLGHHASMNPSTLFAAPRSMNMKSNSTPGANTLGKSPSYASASCSCSLSLMPSSAADRVTTCAVVCSCAMLSMQCSTPSLTLASSDPGAAAPTRPAVQPLNDGPLPSDPENSPSPSSSMLPPSMPLCLDTLDWRRDPPGDVFSGSGSPR